MMKRLYIVCAVLLAGSSARAQWDTNAWPSYEHRRAGNSQLQDLFDAVTERNAALTTWDQQWVPSFSAPSFWRFERSKLIEYKDAIEDLCELYIRTNEFSSGVYTNYCGPLTGFPMYDAESILSAACLPTNWFDYTPWRCLGGAGPFTNDTTVGRGYGWTNEHTEAGGNNFPGSRSTWYTTDYGLEGARSVLALMTVTESYGGFGFYTTATNTHGTNILMSGQATVFGEGGSWTDAIDAVEDEWNNNWTADTGKVINSSYPYRAGASSYSDFHVYFGPESGAGGVYKVKLWSRLTGGVTTNKDYAIDIYTGWDGSTNDFFGLGAAKKLTAAGVRPFWETLEGDAGETNVIGSTEYFGTLDLPNSDPDEWDVVYQRLSSGGVLIRWVFDYE